MTTWVSRIPKNGGRLVYRKVRTHSTWKSASTLPVKKRPVVTNSRVLLCAIHGRYRVSQTTKVLAFVFVKRPLFVVRCCFVKDVHQHCSVLHICDVTGWYFFINDADIPVNLQGDCYLWEVRPSIYKMWQKYSVRIITLSQYFQSFSDLLSILHALALLWFFLSNRNGQLRLLLSLVTQNRHQQSNSFPVIYETEPVNFSGVERDVSLRQSHEVQRLTIDKRRLR